MSIKRTETEQKMVVCFGAADTARSNVILLNIY